MDNVNNVEFDCPEAYGSDVDSYPVKAFIDGHFMSFVDEESRDCFIEYYYDRKCAPLDYTFPF